MDGVLSDVPTWSGGEDYGKRREGAGRGLPADGGSAGQACAASACRQCACKRL